MQAYCVIFFILVTLLTSGICCGEKIEGNRIMRLYGIHSLFCIVLLLLYITPIFSQDLAKIAGGDSLAYESGSIVVTATRVQDARRDLPVSMTTITARELKSYGNSTPLEVVSRLTPGAFITERGLLGYGVASGAAGGVTIRGVGGQPTTNVLVLIDGRPDFMGMMGHPLPDAYQMDNVERIEVIRGPASALYGTNAVGGVINMKSVQLREGENITRIRSSFGSFNTRQYQLNHGQGYRSGYYSVNAGYRESDGHREWSQASIQNYGLKTGYSFASQWNVTAGGYFSRYNIFNPGPISNPLTDNWVDIRRGGADLTLENRYSRLNGSIKLHSNFGHHKIYDGWRSDDNTSGVIVFQNLRFSGGHHITFGFDVKRYGGTGQNITHDIDYGEHFITEYASYAHLHYLLSRRFIFTGGLRYDNNSVFGGITTPSFGLVFQPGDRTAIRGNISEGYRSPTIRELYLFPAPTPTLQPERMWNYELGLERRISNSLVIDLSGFVSQGGNLIRMSGAWPNFILSNSGSFEHRGIEAEAKLDFHRNFYVHISGAWLDPGDDTQASPGQKFSGGIHYASGRITCRLSAERVSKLYGSNFSINRLDDYTIADAHASYRLNDFLSVYGEAKNMFNKSYAIIDGYPLPGRTFFLGLSAGIDTH